MRDVIFKIINQFTKGVDTYYNNGSMWLIFTDEKKWVIELTKEGTLWYNFYFFQDCFKYLSLDVVENQHYITEWVEDTLQNGVRHTATLKTRLSFSVEDTIQNGIKEINHCSVSNDENAKNATEFGIKITLKSESSYPEMIEKVIKETIELPDKSGELNGYGEYYARQKNMTYPHTDIVNDVITDGIKETNWRKVDNHPTYLDHILIEKD